MSTLVKWMMASLLWLPLLAVAAGIDVTLKDMHGRDRNVKEFIGQGKWTVVAVWASSCTICQQEIQQMSFFHQAHKNKDAIVLGISIDGQAGKQQAAGFIKEHRLDFTNLLAELPQMQQFGGGPLMGTPTFYLYSPKGRLRAHQVGPVSREQIEQFMAKGERDPG
jgi:peroxiredoxin